MDNFNYPEGSDNSMAPWNEEDMPEKEVELAVTMTIYKKVKVVAKYTSRRDLDEDGDYSIIETFSSSDLEEAVKEQIDLPGVKDGWDVDDLTIVLR